MSALIEQCYRFLSEQPDVQVQRDAYELIVRLPVTTMRKQTVKISHLQGKYGDYAILSYESRACVASSPKLIRAALEMNGGNELVNLSLNSHVNPPTIDVTYNLIGNDPTHGEIMTVLQRVATIADRIEQRTGGDDRF